MTVCLDSMGNEFLWIKDNGNEKLVTYRLFDAKGLSRETRDAKGRLIERKSYDMAGNDVLEETMDASNLWTLHDVMGRAGLMWRGQDPTWRKETHQNALSQVTYSQASDGSASRYSYNDAWLLDMIEANVRGEKSAAGDLLRKKYVTGVDYNELSHATAIHYGNGQIMTNEFDTLTLRLRKRQTVSPSATRPSKVMQSLEYTYDPTGNITLIRNNAQQDVFFRNRVISPDAKYTYGPTYRLLESSGREQLDNGSGPGGSNVGPACPGAFQTFDATSDAPRDGIPMSRYSNIDQ
ncbi:hypothetical protein J7337_013073 [Fusarium musae]|uniref:YD repeat-containing protein n=1 Tax=Fusarium musae TaxID=1042133 RepID=A0A9P8D3Y9_9HYPO|nr:hypothetical protein J7337_013073 [Fusarium musae]KAG9494844.1 hypothetical protein J7337_013073 [Fusarium musae]